MKYSVIVTDDGDYDVEQAMDWYENKQKGLGKKYLNSFTNSIKLLIKNPFAFAVIFMEIRKVNTKRFPYSLFYQIDEKQNVVVVFAVIHSSRSDEAWKERIDNT